MRFVIGLAVALLFATLQTVSTPALAQGGGKSAMDTGSNATDTKSGSMGSSDSMSKMSSGKAKPKKMKKGKM